MTNFIRIKWNTSRVAVNNCEEDIFVFDIFMIFEQFYLEFCLNNWMDLLLLFLSVFRLCLSICINILASEFLLRNYSLTSAFLSILIGTFMNIKLLSWLKQGYICNIFSEMCTYITTAVHVTYYTIHRTQFIVCFHFF